jgi:hypothetical protein
MLYADDILTVVGSHTGLPYSFDLVQCELNTLDLRLNNAKSVCMHIGVIGRRFNCSCSEITCICGDLGVEMGLNYSPLLGRCLF